ncbi:hypothetical protein AMECASPLE_031033 [Ameca splendens]|uniref:Uncharacterized protein n=1 Tax=Ameca splendens TaxID=208324 RepID=A0ABV1A2G1_9TELE
MHNVGLYASLQPHYIQRFSHQPGTQHLEVFGLHLIPAGAFCSISCSVPPPQVAAVGQLQRGLSTQTDGEERIASILKEKFPLASKLKVVDISGRHASTYGLFELYCHLPCTWCLE